MGWGFDVGWYFIESWFLFMFRYELCDLLAWRLLVCLWVTMLRLLCGWLWWIFVVLCLYLPRDVGLLLGVDFSWCYSVG